MRIERADPSSVAYVAMRMRDADWDELSALSWCETREALVEELVHTYTQVAAGIVAVHRDEPVAVGCLMTLRPRVATLGMFATDKLPLIGRPLTRYVRKSLIEAFLSEGGHRVEAASLLGHHKAHRWLEALGLSEEGVSSQFGKNRETFVQFALVR